MTRGVRVALLAVALGASACGEEHDPREPENVVAEVSEDVGTVVSVSWRTDEPSIGYVAYGTDPDLGLATPLETEPTREHSLELRGLRTDTEYFYRVVTWDGDDAAASDVGEFRTAELPAGVPLFEVEGTGHDGFTVLPILAMLSAVLIIDAEGQVVWYHLDDSGRDIYRARLSLDGTSVLYNSADLFDDVTKRVSEESELVRVSFDGSSITTFPVPRLAHDFVELPDGTLAALTMASQDLDGVEMIGNQIVEVTPDGEQSVVWDAWSCFDPVESPGEGVELEADDGSISIEWTFANALDYDPSEDVYYLGMRNFSSIAKIDRQTGECLWVLGLTAPTLEFASGSERFLHQHQFELRGSRLLVMDNDGATGNQSRLVEYELDLEAGTATDVWSYAPEPIVYSFVFGEPNRLADGSTFINWGAAVQLERVSEEGERLWKLNARAGYGFGFHALADSLY